MPDNNIPEEDDQDYALVIVTIKTGGNVVHMPVIGMVITMLLGGVILIKKYVLL